ncbi:MAG: winged helix-turn-helix transcriptional regulator [Anaerolineales bacterium]|nr:winged helix-turn-helix transcriptional regulator [Anaerolineales bacterium]
MPETLRLTNRGYMRRYDVENILRRLYAMQCIELIGMSNVGKSALLQLLADTDVWIQELGEAGRSFLPVYVDCNRMLGLSEQGFCELVLRCLQEASPELRDLADLQTAYDMVVDPASDFQVPLSFSRGLNAVLQQNHRKYILLFDEFEDPYVHIDARVFLNLRAVQDRYSQQLAFVTATGRPLVALQSETRRGEFAELFSNRSWYLAPLTRSDTEQQVRRYMNAFEANFNATDLEFIYQWSGGHPRMVEGVCQVLHGALEEAGSDVNDAPDRWQFHRNLAPRLRTDAFLADECRKIWDESTPAEQAELLNLLLTDYSPDQTLLTNLMRRYVVIKVEGRPRVFSRLLGDFIQQQAAPAPAAPATIWVDTASGSVTVHGKPIESLTALEYKLMLLFFQNRDRLIDKYQIVTSVWGESYIDEVDDARIEKLISRLRQKIEPDPANPHFLMTVRGRGYRLVVS